ncbi:hypothetical protein DUD43_07345 [Alcaligenes faecalis]|uniref:hypothetical protein n=1 Tax=Alcaligenes faecalis TaxID=511 RepID=UPI0012939F32|nr:hypothetical protein [Alcaligenes faecalis]QFY77514.1 hypothetical protein DUD43_07345 [Alcaligenes faecalis]
MADESIALPFPGGRLKLVDLGDGTYGLAIGSPGGGATGGLTNTELRAAPLEVHPGFATGGNISVSTAANGTDFVVFTARACAQLTVINDSDVVFEVRQGGAGVACPVLSQSSFTFFGISNANQLSVRRKDTGTDPLNVYARWES